MASVLFERVKTDAGIHWHTDCYKCIIVSNWLHLFLWPSYRYEMQLDSTDYFITYEIIKRPYYKTVEYIKDGENIIEWLKDNIQSACYVKVIVDCIGDPEFKLISPVRDIKKIAINFTSKIDAMAFKLRWQQ